MRNTPCQPEFSCSQLDSLALMGYSRKKIQTGGVEGIHFDRKNPWNFNKFVTLPLEIPNKTSGQNKASPLKIPRNCVTKTCCTPEILKLKNKKQTFLDIGISICFLINPWKTHMLFLNTPGHCMPSTSLFAFFLEQPNECYQQLVVINQKQYYRLLGTLTYSIINFTS